MGEEEEVGAAAFLVSFSCHWNQGGLGPKARIVFRIPYSVYCYHRSTARSSPATYKLPCISTGEQSLPGGLCDLRRPARSAPRGKDKKTRPDRLARALVSFRTGGTVVGEGERLYCLQPAHLILWAFALLERTTATPFERRFPVISIDHGLIAMRLSKLSAENPIVKYIKKKKTELFRICSFQLYYNTH